LRRTKKKNPASPLVYKEKGFSRVRRQTCGKKRKSSTDKKRKYQKKKKKNLAMPPAREVQRGKAREGSKEKKRRNDPRKGVPVFVETARPRRSRSIEGRGGKSLKRSKVCKERKRGNGISTLDQGEGANAMAAGGTKDDAVRLRKEWKDMEENTTMQESEPKGKRKPRG